MKKLASLSLALLLALCLASAALAEPVITEPEMPLTDTPVTYTAMIVTHALDTGDPNEKAVYVAREETTGVNIEWTVVPSTSKAERIATTFASGDLPDLFVNMLDNTNVLTYGPAGALLPVSDYLEYMPNFASILETMPDVKAAITMPDGKIYGVPQINMWSVWPGNGVYQKSSVFINREWLDKLGLEVPTTTGGIPRGAARLQNQRSERKRRSRRNPAVLRVQRHVGDPRFPTLRPLRHHRHELIR